MRKCCGYYCAMIAVVGIFFYSVIIVMESRYNNYLMYKMQFPEGAEAKKFEEMSSAEVRVKLEEEADAKITPLIIAIGLNVLCAVGCIVQVKMLEKKERLAALAHEDHDNFDQMAQEVKFD